MISEKTFNKVMRSKKAIEKALTDHNIPFETLGDEHTIAYAGTCTIHTDHCTIEIVGNRIELNEKQVTIEEMISIVLEIEK